MQKYRKKPLVAEAVQLSMENLKASIDMLNADGYEAKTYSRPPMRAISGLIMRTINGEIIVNFGEYLMKGIKGEYYPCPAEVFDASYEVIPDGE